VPIGQWTHVAVTCDGQGMRFFRDGTPISQLAVTPRISDVNAPLMTGSLVDKGFSSAGAIDKAVIHRRVLSDAEVAAMAKPTSP